MNRKQRLVLAIFAPIIILFIALMIANSVGVTRTARTFEGRTVRGSTYYTHNPFDLEKTWYVWFSALAFCGIFEYKLFADKKVINNKKKKDNLSRHIYSYKKLQK